MFFLIKDSFYGIIYVFPYHGLSFQIKDLEIRKFRDKYLLCVFSHNKFPI